MSCSTLSSWRAVSCSTSAPQTVPMTPSGTLNQNTHSQPNPTSHPPSTGPITRPTAATIVFVPIARPSFSRGKASVTSAPAFANTNAPPTPWTIRHRISAVPESANPAPREASVKTAMPATNRRRRPNWSASRPAGSSSTVLATM